MNAWIAHCVIRYARTLLEAMSVFAIPAINCIWTILHVKVAIKMFYIFVLHLPLLEMKCQCDIYGVSVHLFGIIMALPSICITIIIDCNSLIALYSNKISTDCTCMHAFFLWVLH